MREKVHVEVSSLTTRGFVLSLLGNHGVSSLGLSTGPDLAYYIQYSYTGPARNRDVT